jgi:hypothetical protein
MDGQPIILTSNGSSIDISYNAELVIDDNQMVLNQLIQTNEDMNLFETAPKRIKLMRKTLDSELESEEITDKNAKQDNTHGQYIHIWSHYKFNDDDDDGPHRSDPKQKVIKSSSFIHQPNQAVRRNQSSDATHMKSSIHHESELICPQQSYISHQVIIKRLFLKQTTKICLT